MLDVNDERARSADRIEAGKWLADCGFGKAPLVFDAGVRPEELLQDFLSKLSLEDLETMQAILLKYRADTDEITARNQIILGAPRDSG